MPKISAPPIKYTTSPGNNTISQAEEKNSSDSTIANNLTYFPDSNKNVSEDSAETPELGLFHSASTDETVKQSKSECKNPNQKIPILELTSENASPEQKKVALQFQVIFKKHVLYLQKIKIPNKDDYTKIVYKDKKTGKTYTYFLKRTKDNSSTLKSFPLPPQFPNGPSGKHAQVKYSGNYEGKYAGEKYKYKGLVRTEQAIEEGVPLEGTSDEMKRIIEENNLPLLPSYLVEPGLLMVPDGGTDLFEFFEKKTFKFELKHFKEIANAVEFMNTVLRIYHLDLKPENIVMYIDKNGQPKMAIIDVPSKVISYDSIPELSGTMEFRTESLSAVLHHARYHLGSLFFLADIHLDYNTTYSKADKKFDYIRDKYAFVDIKRYNDLPDEFDLTQLLTVLTGPADTGEFINYFCGNDFHNWAESKGIQLPGPSEEFSKSYLMPFILEYPCFNEAEFSKLPNEIMLEDFLCTLNVPDYTKIAKITDDSHLQATEEFSLAALIMYLTGGAKVYELKSNFLGVSINAHVEAWVSNNVKKEYQEQFKRLIENPLYYSYHYGLDRVYVTKMLNFEAAKLKNF